MRPQDSVPLVNGRQRMQAAMSRQRADRVPTMPQICHPHAVHVLEEDYLHICGNSNPILEMMADTGADCVEPLDPMGGVEVADAKRRIGKRVALMGGLSPLTLLNGSPEQVFEEATACCRAGGLDGGYILAAGDMVPDRSPEENVLAMVQAARDFRYD